MLTLAQGAHMRHSWLILITTGTLVFGGALATAGPAAAAPAAVTSPGGLFAGPPGPPVQPGGPIQRTTANVRSGSAKTVALSTNWAGYAATGANGAFTSVSSSWVQPTGNCAFGNPYSDQYSAFWVGLDGYSSTTVEQTGSEVDCAGSTAEYSAWYEFYPADPVYFNNRVRPGDHFTGSVTYSPITLKFTVTLTDSTESWTHTVSQAVPGAKRSSAEVIAEAPCCTVAGNPLPLTNFGSVSFTSATVNSAGLCQTRPVEIIMPEVGVSPISSCEDFSVAYLGGIWNL
jgi:hypothetical protein